jgi:hypothetical protein
MRLAMMTRHAIDLSPEISISIPVGLALRRWRVGVVEKVAGSDPDDYASAYENLRVGTIETWDLGLQTGVGLVWGTHGTSFQLMLAEFHLPAHVLQATSHGDARGRATRHARSADWALLRVSVTKNLN